MELIHADRLLSKSTYKRLQDMTSDSTMKDGDTASTHTSECSICLMSIAVSNIVPMVPQFLRIRIIGGTNVASALPIPLRCSLLTCVALQMHSAYT